MLLGYNSNGLAHHRLEDAIPLLAEHGYEVLALTPDCGHLDPLRSRPSDWKRVADLLRRHGLQCVVESGARYALDPRRKHLPSLLDEDPGDRAKRREYLCRHLEMAEALGARAVSFWAGLVPEGLARDAAEDRFAEELSLLLEEAERRSIPMALEPEPGMGIERVDEALAILERMGDPDLLGLCIDIGHLYVTGEGRPEELLPHAQGRILQVHVEDIRGGIHEHLPPGAGIVDFPALWRALEAVGYTGPVCWELSRSSHAAVEMLGLAKRFFYDRS